MRGATTTSKAPAQCIALGARDVFEASLVEHAHRPPTTFSKPARPNRRPASLRRKLPEHIDRGGRPELRKVLDIFSAVRIRRPGPLYREPLLICCQREKIHR
jgi:hypothetical protein